MKRNKRKECQRPKRMEKKGIKNKQFRWRARSEQANEKEKKSEVEWNRKANADTDTHTHNYTSTHRHIDTGESTHRSNCEHVHEHTLNTASYGTRVFDDTPHTCLAHISALFTIETFGIRRFAVVGRSFPLKIRHSFAIHRLVS